jgi:hypothetical protein
VRVSLLHLLTSVVITTLLLQACSDGGHTGLYSVGDPFKGEFNRVVVVENAGSASSAFRLSIKGFLFTSKEDLLDYIASMPPAYLGEPPYEKAWRLMTLRSYYHVPYTGSSRAHDPLLYLNSVGYGYCDDVAFVLETIWRWQGFESRVWGLEGHVVPEVKVEDRWLMFDPDFGVYYHTAEGQIASVEQLSRNPELILDPVDPIYRDSRTAYSELLVQLYSTVENNRIAELGIMTAQQQIFTLPKGASLKFPVKRDDRAFLRDGETTRSPIYYLAQLTIPAVEVDTSLELPLFLVGASGIGEIELQGRKFHLGSSELHEWFARFAREDSYAEPTTSIKILAGANDVVIDMSLSPFVVEGQLDTQIAIQQESRDALRMTSTYSTRQAPSKVASTLMNIATRDSAVSYSYVSPVESGATLDNLQ